MSKIKSITVHDGRYNRHVKELEDIFSEYGLIKNRVLVEVRWLNYIIDLLKIDEESRIDKKVINSISSDFTVEGAERVKEIESTTNHDVKAVEYFIKEELEKKGLGSIKEWVHFSCTSEDINNTSYAVMLKEGKELAVKVIQELLDCIEALGKEFKSIPMMSRTHGQPASPTTLGKELINFAWRIRREKENLENTEIEGKINGASGNYNAHKFVYPDIDWVNAGAEFLTDSLDLVPIKWTTQINPYNYISELLHAMIRISSVIIDLDRDIWGYISIGYFKQKVKKGEVGSSTMPHKVNPIDFENSEGNLGIGISMMEHLAVKLLNSRFQRDLTDSTVLRNLGSLFGYFIIGLRNCMKGLGKLSLNEAAIKEDLESNLELLAEPVQSLMRVYGEENPYEKLKELTRGRRITQEDLTVFINSLEKVPEKEKARMAELTTSGYVGTAEELVDIYFEEFKL